MTTHVAFLEEENLEHLADTSLTWSDRRIEIILGLLSGSAVTCVNIMRASCEASAATHKAVGGEAAQAEAIL